MVNTLKDLIAIKSGEQCINALSLNNVNSYSYVVYRIVGFLFEIISIIIFLCITHLFDCIPCNYEINYKCIYD